MFKNIFNFSLQRTRKQAFGFYLFYVCVTLLVIVTCGTIFGPDMDNETLQFLLNQLQETNVMPEQLEAYIKQISFISAVTALVFAAALSVVIAMQKDIFKDVKVLMLILSAIIFSYVLGPLIGFICVAWLTTKPSHTQSGEAE